MRSLVASLNDRIVGTLSEGDDLWRFEYDPRWAAASDSFDLSPALPRSTLQHEDRGTDRPVQWYFDNLLPEEGMRDIVSREADIRGDDAFGLLEWLGAESAGSLTLLPPGQDPAEPGGLKPLPDDELCARIRDLPRTSLGSTAPKRMSAAGAQHKLLMVYRDSALYEPTGSQPSIHVLKPNRSEDDRADAAGLSCRLHPARDAAFRPSGQPGKGRPLRGGQFLAGRNRLRVRGQVDHVRRARDPVHGSRRTVGGARTAESVAVEVCFRQEDDSH